MAKKRKPYVPTVPPEWLDTPAQMAGTTVEVVKDDNPNRAKKLRRYRKHPLEAMREGGKISERQMLAGLELHNAWSATLQSPPAIPEITVDSTPRPDDITVAQCERMTTYAKLIEEVPSQQQPIVRHVCCDGQAVRRFAGGGRSWGSHCADLQVGLDVLANHLGY